MQIIWGGKIESNGKRHSENRSIRRQISMDMIKQTIVHPERTTTQSSDCMRYFKTFENRMIGVVAVDLGNDRYEIITVF